MKDITPILAGWDHDPDEVQVRIVAGLDGKEKLQVRLDLGLLQMELEGRPDGRRPEGFESYLDLYEHRAGREAASGEALALKGRECAELMREGVQYYHRYVALFHLQRFDLVARDTERNLRLFAFVGRHATDPEVRLQFDQYRPYVTMMRARALGLDAVGRRDFAGALGHIDAGIAAIRRFLREYGQEDRESECRELGVLQQFRHEVERDRPIGPVERLEQQLKLAVAREAFEEAARLRDQIERLREGRDPES